MSRPTDAQTALLRKRKIACRELAASIEAEVDGIAAAAASGTGAAAAAVGAANGGSGGSGGGWLGGYGVLLEGRNGRALAVGVSLMLFLRFDGSL